MEGGESEDPTTKMDVHLTGMGIGIPEEMVGPMERGGDIGPMDPGANPQLKERNPMTERKRTVTGKHHNYFMASTHNVIFTGMSIIHKQDLNTAVFQIQVNPARDDAPRRYQGTRVMYAAACCP